MLRRGSAAWPRLVEAAGVFGASDALDDIDTGNPVANITFTIRNYNEKPVITFSYRIIYI